MAGAERAWMATVADLREETTPLHGETSGGASSRADDRSNVFT
jgi:hypothetical protein